MKRLNRYLREAQEFDAGMERINELFIKASEINAMPEGRVRDMQMLRLGIIAEYDAANLYEMMANIVSAPKLKELFLEIANEEKVHIGEFEFALENVDPKHEESEDKGEDEAKELTGWEEVDEGLTEDARKQKDKDVKQANKIRCGTIQNAINQRREQIKALLLQARQWECGE